MGERHLTIGELARSTGVATSALRYYEELGLIPAPERISGRRRYPESATALVGTILLLRDCGFSLHECTEFLAAQTRGDDWRELVRRKLAELDEQIARAQIARKAVAHALGCPHDELPACHNFTAALDARLAGLPLEEAHPH
ncbi:MerR family DNA-binding transcriptional regulator [Nonomuraea fuscirosea]|jgi:DNA-binding transcriptional MerR regulator|uniref:DNA-binding transcriptional MerR regulator n=1 Tax=Nonomuraea fuscirosea TaxID=1291556 RepID=A0A2T0MT57_9ACTN|nr:MerR family DNA-binding transcriptional regulator [Nonomuraea fuscirosea]PRX61785.1 DNA-binding transcriptional MerR regulator [Nonomuraea fuscirosea]WSA48687.1 MerR family DNA-binding transcriptional regulator [Nonomuraea fuscirosea]